MTRGTRPKSKPGASGKQWSNKELASALDIHERTVRNWRRGAAVPVEIASIERVLFGDSDAFEEWRLALREAHRAARNLVGEGDLEEPIAPNTEPVVGAASEKNDEYVGIGATRELVTLLAQRMLSAEEGPGPIAAPHELVPFQGLLSAFAAKVTQASRVAGKHHEHFGDLREGLDLTLALASLPKAQLQEAVRQLFDGLRPNVDTSARHRKHRTSNEIKTQIRQYRNRIGDLHSEWLSSIEREFDESAAKEILTLASALESELKFLQFEELHYGQRWISLDTNVVWHYAMFGQKRQPPLESAVSCYLASNPRVAARRTVSLPHREELSAFVGRLTSAMNAGDIEAANALSRVEDLWRNILRPWPQYDVADESTAAGRNIFRQLQGADKDREVRFNRRPKDRLNNRRDAETIANIALINNFGELRPPVICSLATADKSILSLGLQPDYSHCVQHIYGPAWGMFARATFGGTIDFSYIGHLASKVAMTKYIVSDNLRRRYLGMVSSSGDLIDLARLITEFARLVEPFHNEITRFVEGECDEQLKFLELLEGPRRLSAIIFDAVSLLDDMRADPNDRS